MTQVHADVDDDKVLINAEFLKAQAEEGIRTFFAPVIGAAAAVAVMSDPKRAHAAFRLASMKRKRKTSYRRNKGPAK